ncbi:MAG: hypothetical protein IID09_00155 [Candidatus Hydrogenedentes bacterium]|nr:hypothetical protein [Candidatus Hydrogenedentota bacterium]
MFHSKTACINPWKTSAALATLCVCSAAIYAQETERWKRSPDVWEEPRRPGGRSIQTYEQEQRENPPPKEAVLFAGSATIWMWDLERWFPEYKTIKRGFGGSMISDSTYFADRITIPHRPSTIVMYAGDNDVWLGKPADITAQHFKDFVAKIRGALPRTRIIFISIRPSIARWDVVDKFRAANVLIREYIETDDMLYYVDIDAAMLGDDGKPRKELFTEDDLHNSDECYDLWASILKPVLKEAEAAYRADRETE